MENLNLQNVNFAKEGGLESKNERKQIVLRIEKCREKSVSQMEIEKRNKFDAPYFPCM